MELFFVTVIGACIGAIVRYTLPKRHAYGAFLLPAIGAIVAAVVWVVLLWAGLTFDGTWIWVASVGAAILAPVLVAVFLPRRREVHDAQLLAKLSHS